MDMLDPEESAEYVWDDINLPHKLVVRIVGTLLLLLSSILIICCLDMNTFLKEKENKYISKHCCHADVEYFCLKIY